MNNVKYNMTQPTLDIKVAAYNNAEFDTSALASALATLSTESEPQNVTRVISHNAEHKWGQDIFVVGNLFVKAYYTYRFADREAAFDGQPRLIDNWENCAELGLPVPAYKGAFSVKKEDKWMWNGIVAEYLDGWRTLDRNSMPDRQRAQSSSLPNSPPRVFTTRTCTGRTS